ncbi:hypothetical protein K431DRAFT_347193 [Polychaeton citri CBS 116435]|uniref:Uncharacterized protein n=1 Tax=Polychaeton citri CBS 116435 TaxID=1314669 RepID=A0A9P4UN65_9PEZI|nr:hypothetical protein K431DRAFT_347193 [Polychaeton citri CBS 116435]
MKTNFSVAVVSLFWITCIRATTSFTNSTPSALFSRSTSSLLDSLSPTSTLLSPSPENAGSGAVSSGSSTSSITSRNASPIFPTGAPPLQSSSNGRLVGSGTRYAASVDPNTVVPSFVPIGLNDTSPASSPQTLEGPLSTGMPSTATGLSFPPPPTDLGAGLNTSTSIASLANATAWQECQASREAWSDASLQYSKTATRDWSTIIDTRLEIVYTQVVTYGKGDVFTTKYGIPYASNGFTPTRESTSTITQAQSLYTSVFLGWPSEFPGTYPTCTFDSAGCTAAWQSYLRSLGLPTKLQNASEPYISPAPTNRPQCSLGTIEYQCGGTAETSSARSCAINGGRVDIYYWPLVSNERNGTTSKQEPVTAVIGNMTFTSPSVYMSLDTVYAERTVQASIPCTITKSPLGALDYLSSGLPMGGPADLVFWNTHDVWISIDPVSLSSLLKAPPANTAVSDVASELAHGGRNFDEYISGVFGSWSATSSQWNLEYLTMPRPEDYYLAPFATAPGLLEPAPHPAASTIFLGAYRPLVSVPAQLRQLHPSLQSCDPGLYGLYDPPFALTPQNSPALPTVSSKPTGITSPHPGSRSYQNPVMSTTTPDYHGSGSIGDSTRDSRDGGPTLGASTPGNGRVPAATSGSQNNQMSDGTNDSKSDDSNHYIDSNYQSVTGGTRSPSILPGSGFGSLTSEDSQGTGQVRSENDRSTTVITIESRKFSIAVPVPSSAGSDGEPPPSGSGFSILSSSDHDESYASNNDLANTNRPMYEPSLSATAASITGVVIQVGGDYLTATEASKGIYVIEVSTITGGQAVTPAPGQVVSVNGNGMQLGSSMMQAASTSGVSRSSAEGTFGFTAIDAESGSTTIIDSRTMSVGSPAVILPVSGYISLSPSGLAIVGNGVTSIVHFASKSAVDSVHTIALTIGSAATTAREVQPAIFAFGSHTLSVGGPGLTVGGEDISAVAASTLEDGPGSTVSLDPAATTEGQPGPNGVTSRNSSAFATIDHNRSPKLLPSFWIIAVAYLIAIGQI